MVSEEAEYGPQPQPKATATIQAKPSAGSGGRVWGGTSEIMVVQEGVGGVLELVGLRTVQLGRGGIRGEVTVCRTR